MKTLIVTSMIALLLLAGNKAAAGSKPDDYLGLPGDNLNLYAVMKLFQDSKTLEEFERDLNDPNTRINNLDLNGDNLIDYITVSDHQDGNVHNIVLQDAISPTEKQDVAVFTVQRFSNGSVQIQLIGDEALYGKNYIIEPNYAETPNPGYVGSTAYVYNSPVVSYTAFDIAAWPLITFLFAPGYIAWHSLWYWDFWPSYWHPWHPFYWDYYYGYFYNCYPDYYSHYHHCGFYRYSGYHDFYYSNIRSHSMQVNRRIREGDYRATYSHPEQRREGAALYSRMNPGQNQRRANSAALINQGRRTAAPMTNERRPSTGNYNTQRSANGIYDRRGASNSTLRNGNVSQSSRINGTVRTERSSVNRTVRTDRSSVTNSNPGRRTSSFQNTPDTRRMTASAATRPATNSYSAYSGRAARSSSQSFSSRAASRPSQSYRGSSSGSFSHSSARSSAPSQRSSGSISRSSSGGHSGSSGSGGGSKGSSSSHRR